MNRENLASFGIGIGVGILIGGIIGILYAPTSGKETRKTIRDKSGKFAADVRAKINRATISDIKGR
jgi:gas vesicle protein